MDNLEVERTLKRFSYVLRTQRLYDNRNMTVFNLSLVSDENDEERPKDGRYMASFLSFLYRHYLDRTQSYRLSVQLGLLLKRIEPITQRAVPQLFTPASNTEILSGIILRFGGVGLARLCNELKGLSREEMMENSYGAQQYETSAETELITLTNCHFIFYKIKNKIKH